MELTGKNFDMNPETFTLENLFAMELHNYAETISDIVASANKELSIEKSLSEVVSTWQTLRFTVIKYVNTHTLHEYVDSVFDTMTFHVFIIMACLHTKDVYGFFMLLAVKKLIAVQSGIVCGSA